MDEFTIIRLEAAVLIDMIPRWIELAEMIDDPTLRLDVRYGPLDAKTILQVLHKNLLEDFV